MKIRSVVAGVAIVAVSFALSLWTMNWLWPRGIERPALAALPPLPAVTPNTDIVAPIVVSLSAIRDAVERNAPKTFGGKVNNPVAQLLSNADINWTVTRGEISASGSQNTLSLSTPLDGKMTALGSLSASSGSALGNALNNALGSNVAKQIGNINIKNLNANASINGTAAMSARPELLANWRLDPKLNAQINLSDSSLSVAGAKVGVPAQIKPLIDKTVNEQIDRLQQRLRNDTALEQTVRREWVKMCRSVALPAAVSGLPPLWLEIRPVRAVAAQPLIDSQAVTLTLGLQAETRVTTNDTKPTCPFPDRLDIVQQAADGRVSVGVPIDLSFSDVSKIVESQLKERTFPEDGSGKVAVTVKEAAVSAAGDRLLISLLVNAREKESWFGFSGEATIHIWGRPSLERERQILRLTDLELAVESDAAFGLLGAAARSAIPAIQRALEARAAIDLRAFTVNAQQRLGAVISDFRRNDAGMRVDATVGSLRLDGIAFDSKTLRVTARAEGAIRVSLTSLQNF